ncbi:MAG: asparagine synthase (glutamine-hydrolyzing), partial [Bacillota bacterium]|nr:asparagine synthase (glutamine-hydrolyzing) [Bacillota bacterium]
MCGIAGWVDWNDDLRLRKDILQDMTESLTPRGPDASGTWLSEHAALGHRRLIVIDPSGGLQPMTRTIGNNSFTLIYNGELYNTEDLRGKLLNRGYTFAGHSDTEVLLVSYLEWGSKCVEWLNGIFAFAVWDEKNQSLFMARDRVGVKPLFYSQQGSTLIFGSELKAMLAHPRVMPYLNEEGLAEIFAMGPSRTPGHGVFKNVAELRPGYWLRYDRNSLKVHQYWQLESKPHLDDLDTTTAKVRMLFEDAVRRQLVSDVPICTLLSGGLDSSAISAFAARHCQETGQGPLTTLSVDYVDNDQYFMSSSFQPNADAPWIKKVSDYLGTNHHDIKFDTPELVEALTAALYARDLPGMADIDASLYLFCKKIKEKATVALSGECADEVFGGYPWFAKAEGAVNSNYPWIRMLKERSAL